MSKNEKFIIWCDKLMAFSFYALIYFLPISIALSETFTGLSFFAYLLKRGGILYGFHKNPKEQSKYKNVSFFRKFIIAYKPATNILNLPILIFLVVNLISLFQSQDVHLSLEGFVGKVLQSVFLYFNFIECIRSRKRVRMFLTVFFISGTLIIVNAFYQIIVGQGFIFEHVYVERVTSSFRSSNDFGAYLIVLIPLLFSISFLPLLKEMVKEDGQSGKAKMFSFKMSVFCALLFIFALVSLGLTFSRGAWIGFIFSVIILGLTNRKSFLLYGAVIIIFLMMFYPSLMEFRLPITDKQTFLDQNNRLKYWERATGIIKDYPIFGSGVNTYALVEGRYNIGWGGYPHNSFLQMTAETGIIGVLSFLWMLIVLFRESSKAYLKIKVQEKKMLLLGAQTGLMAFLIHSFFDTNFYSVQLGSLMWLMMGLIISVQHIKELPGENRKLL